MRKTVDKPQKNVWFALADAKRCRLLSCSLTKQGTQHVHEHDAVENLFPESEHIRPQSTGGMSHDVEERERRFAGQIVEWLRESTAKHEIEQLAIFATPRMLGGIRKVSSGLLDGHLEEIEASLMRLDPGQLAEHPMVYQLIQAMPKRSLEVGGRE